MEENSSAVAERADAGNQAIDASIRQIKDVEETVTSSAGMVDRLGERSKQIGEIVDTMTGIAEQTNLLALNAAVIEGAQSVESLRTMFAEINQLVVGVSGEITQVTDAIHAVADATNDIAGEMKNINDYSGKVASEMQSVSAATEEQSASAEEIAAASEALATLAQGQQEALAHFRF